MAPEPIRPEPGPRDWTPDGSSTPTWTSTPERRPRRTATLGSEPGWVGPAGATFFGMLAVATAAFTAPRADGSSTVILSTVGLLAIGAGIATRPRAAIGARGRRVLGSIGIALGALALVSTGFTVLNSTFSTSLPTLHDATRALWPESVIAAPAVPAAPSNAERSLTEPVSILSVADERAYLTKVITLASELIDEVGIDPPAPPLQYSDESYPYVSDEGGVVIGSAQLFGFTYEAAPGSGYIITIQGETFGSVVQYDSRGGFILVR